MEYFFVNSCLPGMGLTILGGVVLIGIGTEIFFPETCKEQLL